MRYLSAYLLVALGGKADPTAADIEKVLSSVGIDADKKKIDLVLQKLKGKDVETVITEGSKKLASLPAAGAAAPAAGGGGASAAGKTEVKDDKPAKKEEKKEEKEEEGDEDMGFGLFD